MTLPELAVRRPVATIMLVFLGVLLGTVSLARLEVTLFPELEAREVRIWIGYPDAGVDEIEEDLARPVESLLASVTGAQRVSSEVVPGGVEVVLRLRPGTDAELAALAVRERLDTIRWDLPEGAERPVLVGGTGERPGMVLALAAPDRVLAAEWARTVLRPRLEQLEGVARVQIVGAPEAEIAVEPDPARMRAFGVTAADLRSALESATLRAEGGKLRRLGIQYAVEWEGGLRVADDVARTVVRPGTRPIRVQDVAEVTERSAPDLGWSRLDGRPAVGALVYRASGANLLDTASAVRRELDRLAEEESEVETLVLKDPAPFVSQSVAGVWQAVVLGGVLAFLVLVYFLRDVRAALVLGTALPASVLTGFALFELLGLSLNLMSLGGIALGVGMLVDNGIVCLESIDRLRVRGVNATTAAGRGAREIAGPITASTLTTCAVFLPMAAVPGPIGGLLRDQAVAVTVSLLVSLAIALTLVPTLAARMGKGNGNGKGTGNRRGSGNGNGSGNGSGSGSGSGNGNGNGNGNGSGSGSGNGSGNGGTAGFGTLAAGRSAGLPWFHLYHRALGWGLRHPGLTLGSVLLLVLGSCATLARLPREILPDLHTDQIEVELDLPPGSDVSTTDVAAREIEGWLSGRSEVSHVLCSVGAAGELVLSPHRRLHRAVFFVQLREAGENRALLVRELLEGFASRTDWRIEIGQSRPELESILPSGEVGLACEISAPDPVAAERTARTLFSILAAGPGGDGFQLGFDEPAPRVDVSVRADAASRLGIEEREVRDAVAARIGGAELATARRFDRDVPIVLRPLGDVLPGEGSLDLDGRSLPSRAVAHAGIGLGGSRVVRVDQARVARVFWDGPMRDVGAARTRMEDALRTLPLPRGGSARLAGSQLELRATLLALMRALLLSTGLVLLILAAQFESLRLPWFVLLAIPLASIGVAVGLVLTRGSLNAMSGVGLVVLVGIVVNDAILKVDLLRQARPTRRGRLRAVVDASRRRYRPILMTTATTSLGLLPVYLGAGAELRAPLATVVIGGLTSATLLTLLVVPVVFLVTSGARPDGVPASGADS